MSNTLTFTLAGLLLILQFPSQQVAQAQTQESPSRFLFAAVHNSKHFPKTETGLFVFDIENGHQLVDEITESKLGPHRAGWGGMTAHAETGRLIHIDDQHYIRCFDIVSRELLWERGQETKAERKWAAAEEGRDIKERSFSYIERRTGITKDGKYLLIPDRQSANPRRGFGTPVVRVLDMETGEWVKNIPLVDPAGEDRDSLRGNPHHLQVMRNYIYASKWNDGHVYLINPQTLEVERRIGPVTLYDEAPDSGDGAAPASEGANLGYEPDHQSQSIQHFSVSPDEKYVFVEPVKSYGLGIIEVESGEYLGRWDHPDPETPGIQKERFDANMRGNKLHSKLNHGIAVRPGTNEVWTTSDRWGYLHVWDVSQFPPKHVRVVPVYEDIKERVMDFSWVNFSIDGDYCYAFDKVIDAETGEIVKRLPGLNESSLEIQILDDQVVRTGHGCGSGLETWTEGFDIRPSKQWPPVNY